MDYSDGEDSISSSSSSDTPNTDQSDIEENSSYHFNSGLEAQPGVYGTSFDNGNINLDDLVEMEELLSLLHESLEREKAQMLEVATDAMEELLKLLNTNEPLWAKSSDDMTEFILVEEKYFEMFPRPIDYRNRIHQEGSKHSRIIRMGGIELVGLFLDSETWANLFPSIISEAQPIRVFDDGSPINHSGALRSMREEVHVLSPLVPSREYYFLRYCQQVDAATWVITDVSLPTASNNSYWKCPSGCMIREMPDGSSMVTWVEHVVVMDDRINSIRKYKPLIQKSIAYGAKRWLLALHRMWEKFVCYLPDYIPRDFEPAEQAIRLHGGRKRVVNLSNQVVQEYSRVLNMSRRLDFQILDEDTILTRYTPTPCGIVVSAITSVWLPVSPNDVFRFLNDESRRKEWDIACGAKPVHEIARISAGGVDVYNTISIIETISNRENSMMYLKESCQDPLGAFVVYAPMTKRDVDMALAGGDPSFPIIPSGFTVSSCDRQRSPVVEASGSSGNAINSSLLTVAFQLLNILEQDLTIPGLREEYLVKSYASFTIQKIKVAFGC